MPANSPPPDTRNFQFLHLEDFTPGIWDYSSINNSTPVTNAPQGFADQSETYSCIALPNGGLGPLPTITGAATWPLTNNGTGPTYITGLLVHQQLADGTTEAFTVGEYDDGVNHVFGAMSFHVEANNYDLITTQSSASSGPGIFGSPYPVMSRMALSNPLTTVGNPVIVFPAAQTGPPGHLYVYPDPLAPTAYGVGDLIVSGPGTITGQVYAHQSRILVTAGATYDYPAGGGFNTNEQINYTDPPNSIIYGDQEIVFVAEDPYGYGCGGSQSAGELFMVKQRGGGLIVSGDLNSPSVTFFPGVQPTGAIVGRGASTPEGFYYCSAGAGAWVWNGGNTSSKISKQLDDNFFQSTDMANMDGNNYEFFCEPIGDKVYFSNNWVYDTRINSWWRYYPTEAQNVLGRSFFWTNYVNGRYFYCAPISFLNSSKLFLWQFDQLLPSPYWSWQSLPIRVSENHYINIREIIVRASNSYGAINSQIRVQIIVDNQVVAQVTTPTGAINPIPHTIRMPIGGANNVSTAVYPGQDVTVNIYATGGAGGSGYTGGGAPILHYLDIAYRERQTLYTTPAAS